MVTNCHVLRRAQRVAVRHEKTTITATLTHWDVQRDVCQLKAPGLAAPAVNFGDTTRASVGQDVYAIGHPKGLELTMSAGLISSFRRNENSQLVLIQTSAAVSAGSSGGGLFDSAGRLLGLVTIGSVGADTQNLNFAIPVDWVRDLPERHARLNAPAKAASGATASASGAAASAAAPAPAAGNRETTTALNDLNRLPYANERMKERYSQFLTRPLPRAFVISEGGDWRLAWGKPTGNATGLPAERAMKECEALKRGRCFVYAVDNEVVYRP
jgi:serine protease Do